MYPTLEVRWFFKGEIPQGIWDWVEDRGLNSIAAPARIDYYLRIAESDSLGVKLREGRIEVKQRFGQREIVNFGDQAAGYLEQWRKWSFPVLDTQEVLAELGSNPSNWVGVRKTRHLGIYQSTDHGIEQAAADTSLNLGCGWEFVALQVEGLQEPWCSVGFESFGTSAKQRDILLSVAENLLLMKLAPKLGLVDSFGYPRWLQLQAKG
jgi:hypothetical protein